jgi:hypothetical protein
VSRVDHDTSTVDAAGAFERDTSEPDWDRAIAAAEARRESFPRVEPPATPSRNRRPEWDDLW